MKRIIKVVECSDHDECYGLLEIHNITEQEVQEKIYEIKNDERFLEECPDWTIEDVFERFPTDWEWTFTQGDGYLVEI